MCSPVFKEIGNLALKRQMLALQSDPHSATSDRLKLAFGARAALLAWLSAGQLHHTPSSSWVLHWSGCLAGAAPLCPLE